MQLVKYVKQKLTLGDKMASLPFEVVDAREYPMEIIKLPRGSLIEIIDTLFSLPVDKAIRLQVDGSLIHIAQHLRNAATRKGKKISIAVRGSYIYVGRG